MLDRPRRGDDEPISEWRQRREAYVAQHRAERSGNRAMLRRHEDAIAWLIEPGAAIEQAPAAPLAAGAVARAEEALERLQDAASRSPAPVSSVDTLTLSPRLRALLRAGEPLSTEINRLSAALRLEFDEVNNLTLTPGGASRILDSGKTAGLRHHELSELLNELAELGAQMERR